MTDFAERLARLRARMAETGTDLVAVGPTSNMVWLSGLAPHGDERPVMLLVTADFAGFLIPGLNADSQRPYTDLPFFTWADADGPAVALADILGKCGLRDVPLVAVDEGMRADFALLLLDALPGARRSFLPDTLGYLRSRKDAAEYAILKRGAVLNDAAMQAGFAALREGMTEREVADIITRFFADNVAVTEFKSVCFAGNGAFPHHATGETRLKHGMAVLIDIGARKEGYPSDMTRVGWFGAEPAEFGKVHAIVNRAVEAALAAAVPGARARDVDAAARGVISAAGYGERFLHRTGHGLGIDIHEAPYITASSETVLDEGMVFSIEPGVYLSGQFGLRLEEIVMIRGGRAEILSDLPRDAFGVV